MLDLWENPTLSMEDRLAIAGGEIDRLRRVVICSVEDAGYKNRMLKNDIDLLSSTNSELLSKIAALEYSLKLDEELIGMVQKVISVLNNRPVPNATD